MNAAVKDTLEAINSRFPVGSHVSKIRLMIDGMVPYDHAEVRRGLERIKKSGGSRKVYTTESDIADCDFYLKELEEAKNFSYG